MTTGHLVCFPYAGAGPSMFHRWRLLSSGSVNIFPVSLPGRERRIVEPPYRTVSEAVEGVYPELLANTSADEAVIVFGHSLGAVLAYELTRKLQQSEDRQVVRLFVSGSPAPNFPRKERATGLSDAAFIAQVRRFAGYSHDALDHEEMRQLVLPTLRADAEMHENYHASPGELIKSPITVFRGRDDDLVSADTTQEWQYFTKGDFESIEVDGGHMYLTSSPEPIIACAEATMKRYEISLRHP